MIRLRFIQRYRLSYWCMKPLVEAQVTIVPPLRAAYTEAPNVSRPGCSKTMSTSSPPVSSRIVLPRRRHSLGSWVCSSFQNLQSSSERLMISSAPMARQMDALSSLDTTQTGVAPPLTAYWVAKPPRPPEAPQIKTLSPCFMPAPLRLTSWRYAVELTRPGEAASSQVRWRGLGISWLDLTIATSASPPKFVSNPQIRCSGSSIVSLWPSGLSSSTERQCATPSSPGDQRWTPGPILSTTPERSEPTMWYGRSWRAESGESRP